MEIDLSDSSANETHSSVADCLEVVNARGNKAKHRGEEGSSRNSNDNLYFDTAAVEKKRLPTKESNGKGDADDSAPGSSSDDDTVPLPEELMLPEMRESVKNLGTLEHVPCLSDANHVQSR